MNQWINFQQTLPQRLTLETLDREQTRAKDFGREGSSIVRGVAGSGKSLVLRNRIETLIDNYDKILVLSFNRFMKGWIDSKLAEKELDKKVDCYTFHSWAYRFLGYDYKWDQEVSERQKVIALADKSKVKYQAILVDEAQDFYDEWFRCLLNVVSLETNSLFFVYDNTQSVYGQPHRRKSSWTWKELGIEIPGGRSQIFDLNYRNAPEILDVAWNFIKPALLSADMKVEKRERDESGRIKNTPGIGSIIEPRKKTSRSSNIKPLLVQLSYEDLPKQVAQQVKIALQSFPESSIGILTRPQEGKLRQEISKELSQLEIGHHAPKSSTERNINVVDRPFVIVDSWNALKGVEFDAVIIAGIDKIVENIDNKDLDFQEKAGLYTAMTRARDHLIMLYENKNLMVELLEHSLTSASELDSDN